jgi:hypothetical protein
MSKKTRKHIWPVSLVMALAIIVTVSGFIVLATNPGGVQAQEDCSALSPDERAQFEALGGECQDDTSGPPPPPSVPTTPVPSTPVPSTPVPAGPGSGGSGGSSVSGGENVEVPPGRPMNLTAEAYTDGIPQEEIQLTWDSPTDGGSTRQYRIDISENDGTTWYALESDVRNTRYLHDNLSANQTFTYRVFATNQHGISAVSNDDSGTTANSWVPERPARLTADVGTESRTPDIADTDRELTIMLDWNEPVDPPGAPVTSYVVEYSIDGEVWDPADKDHGLLDAGYTYQYRVAAVNSVGRSGWSSTASDTTLPGALPPVPQNLRYGIAPKKPNTWLYWNALDPETPIGDNITRYEIEGRPVAQPEMDWAVVKSNISIPNGEQIHSFLVTADDVSENTQYTLTADAAWEFRIRALNRRVKTATAAEVESTWSSAGMVTPGSDTAPLRPENLTVTRSEPDNEGRTGLLLEFDKAESLLADHNGDGTETIENADRYRIEYSDTGLRDEEGYNWKVLADGEPAADPDASRQSIVDNHDVLDDVMDDLNAGKTRHYRVFGFIGDEMSWPSPQNSGITAAPLTPAAPQRLAAEPEGHTANLLEWQAPDANNDDLDGSEEGPSVIMHYVVEVSDDQGQTWSSLAQVMGLSYTDGGLLPGTTRDYRVAAVNATAESVWSNTAEATTIAAVLPNEPGGLAAEAYGTSSIKLCWNAQATEPEAAPVTSYRIEHLVNGTWTYLDSVTGEVGDVPTIHTATGLTPDTSYDFRVSAINLRGQSDQSDVATATTDAGPPSTALTAPTMVSAMGGAGTVMVSWEDGENAVGHLVILLNSSFEIVEIDDSPTNNESMFSGLSAGTYYGVVVAFKSASDYEYAYDAARAN